MLTIAILSNNMALIELLIGLNAHTNPNFIDDAGMCLLMKTTNVKLIRYLINLGADVNYKNHEGLSVLRYHIMYENLDVSLVLIDKGANCTEIDTNGNTLLMLSTDILLLRSLLGHGANAIINVKNDQGNPPIIYHNAYENIKTLILYGADVNIIDLDGRTSLMHACIKNNKQLVQLLLDHGAEINNIDFFGNSVDKYIINKQILTLIRTNINLPTLIKQKEYRKLIDMFGIQIKPINLKYTDDHANEIECCICLQKINCETTCKHNFCIDCYLTYYKINKNVNNCAICRTKLDNNLFVDKQIISLLT
jgi:hypothetical protein